MIMAHYEHRLPTGYDMSSIRRRAVERGPLWNAMPGLNFKAFTLREAGRFGATTNSYSSFYLWKEERAFSDWLVQGGYQVVIDAFGRAEIETLVALEIYQGPAAKVSFLYREDVVIPPDADLIASIAFETERARTHAARPDIVAAVAGLDVKQWKFVRIALSAEDPNDVRKGITHQIGFLARPMPATTARA